MSVSRRHLVVCNPTQACHTLFHPLILLLCRASASFEALLFLYWVRYVWGKCCSMARSSEASQSPQAKARLERVGRGESALRRGSAGSAQNTGVYLTTKREVPVCKGRAMLAAMKMK